MAWWDELRQKGPKEAVTNPLDICNYCGHIRGLHAAIGCAAKARTLTTPNPCDCSNVATGSLYRDPTDRIRKETSQ